MAVAAADPVRGAAVRPVGRLAAAVSELAGEDLARVDAASVGDSLVEIRRQCNRLEAEFARRLRRFGELGGPRAAGAVNSAAWARRHCNMSGVAAASRAEVASSLDSLPRASALLATGEIGIEHAAAMARAVTQLGPEAIRHVEAALIDAALRTDPGRFWHTVRQLRHCADPGGSGAAAELVHTRRFLRLSPGPDGGVSLEGLLDAASGAQLCTVIDRFAVPTGDDPRSSEQRRADALVEMARRASGGGGRRLNGCQLTVTVPLATLRREPGTPGGETTWGVPLGAETVRRLACDSARTVVAVAEDGTMSVGRTSRVITRAMRRALEIRDRGCRFPGCTRPPSWTEAHHLGVHWADGGETSLANMALLCEFHHHLAHEGGWTLRWGSGGTVEAIPP